MHASWAAENGIPHDSLLPAAVLEAQSGGSGYVQEAKEGARRAKAAAAAAIEAHHSMACDYPMLRERKALFRAECDVMRSISCISTRAPLRLLANDIACHWFIRVSLRCLMAGS